MSRKPLLLVRSASGCCCRADRGRREAAVFSPHFPQMGDSGEVEFPRDDAPIWVQFMVSETKGRSFEEIQHDLGMS